MLRTLYQGISSAIICPLAEKYYGTSPYALCGGNPVRYVDLDGRWSAELNINLSVGVQSSGSIGFAGVTFNLFSATLMDVNVKYDSETENHFSFDASMIAGPDGKTEISQEASFSVPFLKIGAKHFFETTGSSSVKGTDKIEPILPVSTEDDNIKFKTSYGGSVIIGGEANLSVTF